MISKHVEATNAHSRERRTTRSSMTPIPSHPPSIYRATPTMNIQSVRLQLERLPPGITLWTYEEETRTLRIYVNKEAWAYPGFRDLWHDVKGELRTILKHETHRAMDKQGRLVLTWLSAREQPLRARKSKGNGSRSTGNGSRSCAQRS